MKPATNSSFKRCGGSQHARLGVKPAQKATGKVGLCQTTQKNYRNN